jgi:hypothetical protein
MRLPVRRLLMLLGEIVLLLLPILHVTMVLFLLLPLQLNFVHHSGGLLIDMISVLGIIFATGHHNW